MVPQIGVCIDGRYRLLGKLGRGGMGVVYKAEHLVTGRLCALKLLHADWLGSEELKQRLFIEARAAARTRHPNIVDVIDAGNSEFGPYLAMEWLRGESLASVLTSKPRLDIPTAVAIAAAVLEGLEAAHGAGIVHRDLKPANVFLVADTDCRALGVKMLDFGVAKILDSTAGLTQSGRVIGTAEYLSPEQASGVGSVDARSDLFAAGVLLFQMLTGVSPFYGPNLVATTYRIAHVAPPSLLEVGGPSDPELQRIVTRALEKDRNERFSSAREMADALTALAAGAEGAALSGLRLQPDSESVIRDRTTDNASSPHWSETPDSVVNRGATLRVSGPSTPIPSSPGRVRSAAVLVQGAKVEEIRAGSPSRPSPERPARPEVGGRVLRALHQTTRMRHGRDIAERAAIELIHDTGQLYWPMPLDPHGRYDVALFEAYCRAVEELVGVTHEHWRGMGQAAVEAELVTDLRPLFRAADAVALTVGALETWGKLFEFGTWHFERGGDTRFRVFVEQFHPAGARLQAWVAGLVEQTYRAAGFASASVSTVALAIQGTPLTLSIVLA